jgi:hypothetical protein
MFTPARVPVPSKGSIQTMKREVHHWPGARDATWALVWLIGGILFVLASIYVPA